jgi:hypothetical protein
MRRKFPALAVCGAVLAATLPAAAILVLRWDAPDGPLEQPWRFAAGGIPYLLFVAGMIWAGIHMYNMPKTWPVGPREPHWRSSHRAVAPNGSLVAEIAKAMEHSMANPTVGTLRISDGLEMPYCSPAFLWSDDSRYLAVPRWEKCGLFRNGLRQRLVIVDVGHRTLHVSPFVGWLLLPRTFEQGKLDVLPSHSAGITFGWKKEPLIVDVPQSLQAFKVEPYAAGAVLQSDS